MRVSSLKSPKVVLAVLILAVLWNEWISFYVNYVHWKPFHNENLNCTNLLLVADPQLIGYQNEPWWIGWLSRWDADRYLQKGYAYAYAHTKPELVLFLGDLLDEGLSASVLEYQLAATRFHQIFNTGVGPDKQIFIPGDNDVGGEYGWVIPELVAKFDQIFPTTRYTSIPNLGPIDFHFLNVFNMELRPIHLSTAPSTQRILLSHMPVMKAWSNALMKATEINATLILSAHDHTAHIYTMEYSWVEKVMLPGELWTGYIGPNRRLVEIKTPTCSYRMGVPQMAYGHLSLCPLTTDTMAASYQLLPLPGRYPQVFVYIIILIWLLSTLLLNRFNKCDMPRLKHFRAQTPCQTKTLHDIL
ncbi:unnamed protein product, partial [Mesorhabditis spiculigera]